MNAAVRLSWRMLRGGGRASLLSVALSVALSVVAVAVSVALLLLTLAFNHGFNERARRAAWRQPVPAAGAATAVQAVSTEFVQLGQAGHPIVVVDLAQLDPAAPVPPGMERFPTPGQVWFSPALADLAARLPADQLAARFPGGSDADRIPAEALVRPDELVAIVGRDANEPAMTAPRHPDPRREGDISSPTRIDRFATAPGDFSTAKLYTDLAKFGAILVTVPLLVLGGAAARLSVARRDRRLAALRLFGATPFQVATVTVTEAVCTGSAGAIAGGLVYAFAVPLATHLALGGGSWFLTDLWVGAPTLLEVLLGAPLLVGVSAVAGLRQVLVSPLGVVRRQTPPRLRAVRLVCFGAAMVGYVLAVKADDPALTTILVLLAVAYAALALVGPWSLGLLGRLVAARSRGPVGLLAGRRLADDPRSAWRTVGGITLAGFVAGLLAPFAGHTGSSPWGPPDRLELSAPAVGAEAAVELAGQRLSAAGIDADIALVEPALLGAALGERVLTATVRDPDVALDRARTALSGLMPGQAAVTGTDVDWLDRQISADYALCTVLVLAAAFAVGTVSAGIVSATSVLDRQRTLRLLRLAGFPLDVLDRIRSAEVMLPLGLTGVGAILAGLACAAPFTLLAHTPMSPRGVETLAACVAVGVAGIGGAIALSRPLLRTLTREPVPEPD